MIQIINTYVLFRFNFNRLTQIIRYKAGCTSQFLSFFLFTSFSCSHTKQKLGAMFENKQIACIFRVKFKMTRIHLFTESFKKSVTCSSKIQIGKTENDMLCQSKQRKNTTEINTNNATI